MIDRRRFVQFASMALSCVPILLFVKDTERVDVESYTLDVSNRIRKVLGYLEKNGSTTTSASFEASCVLLKEYSGKDGDCCQAWEHFEILESSGFWRPVRERYVYRYELNFLSVPSSGNCVVDILNEFGIPDGWTVIELDKKEIPLDIFSPVEQTLFTLKFIAKGRGRVGHGHRIAG